MKLDTKKIIEVVIEVVKIIELLQAIPKSGRRAEAIHRLDEKINLPFPLSLIEKHIYGLLIDTIVTMFNKTIGHDWIKRLAG